MVDVAGFIHAAAQDYDPVKAHEYYMRTRELKPRTAAGLKTTAKKESWQDAREQIDREQKATLDATSRAQEEALAAIRSGAQAMREAIAAKLKEALSKLDETAETERDRIAGRRAELLQKATDEANRKIAALPPIPPNVGKAKAAQLAAERREAIARIKGDVKREREQIAADSAKEAETASEADSRQRGSARGSARGSTNLDREQVAAGLKDSIVKAQKNFTVLKEAVKAKYETKYQSEYDAIKNNL